MTKKRVAFYTLGCKLNFSETSTIARQFSDMGFQRVQPNEESDIYIINTCSVTEQADRKCRQVIRRFNAKAPQALIAVVGCYAQLKPNEIASIEGVDIVIGALGKDSIPLYLNSVERKNNPKVFSCDIDEITNIFPAYSSADRTRSFLKVQDGCDYHCSYCTIPLARGLSRNVSIEKLIDQANTIVSTGIKEIILTGVNTGDFGKSTNEKFIDLLKNLEQVDGLERIRISSVEPNLITNEIIGLVANSKKLLPHFHIPLQSGSNQILALMKRRYNAEQFAERIRAIKSAIPNVFIGVDVIVGFPGETNSHFLESYSLLRNLDVSFLHVFPYSPRPNTSAAELQGKVTQRTVTGRVKQLMELSNVLHRNFYESNLGTSVSVLFESSQKGNHMHGFTQNYIKVEHPYQKELVNQIVRVKLKEISPSGNFLVDIIH
jgi:threonylcarbamoyladenosine tRNA methylthiotransferase MtaB